MKIKNGIFASLLSALLIFSLVGCDTYANTEYKNVEVTVVGEYYSAMWMQPVLVGEITTFITYPERYEIIVEYNGTKYTIDNIDTYGKYKDKIGQIAIGELEIKTYYDGAVRHDIISLE
jgi:hypothetical protein